MTFIHISLCFIFFAGISFVFANEIDFSLAGQLSTFFLISSYSSFNISYYNQSIETSSYNNSSKSNVCMINLPKINISSSSSSSTGSRHISSSSSSSSSSIVTNIYDLSTSYLVSNNAVLTWKFINSNIINQTVVIIMNGTILIKNQNIGTQYRSPFLNVSSIYNFTINNLTLFITTPITNIGIGSIYMPTPTTMYESIVNYTSISEFNLYSYNGSTYYGEVQCGMFCCNQGPDTTCLTPAIFYYAVVSNQFSLSAVLDSIYGSYNDQMVFRLVYTSSLTDVTQTQYVWGLINLNGAGWYASSGLGNTNPDQEPPYYLAGKLTSDGLFTLIVDPGGATNTYELPSVPNMGFVGITFSGTDLTFNMDRFSIATGLPGIVENIVISQQPNLFATINPSNNYNVNYEISWDVLYGASTYNIYYTLLSSSNENNSTLMASDFQYNEYILGGLSIFYNYTIFVCGVNVYGQGPCTSYLLLSSSAAQQQQQIQHTTTASFCGNPGIDYIAYNSFGQYVYQVPSSSCSQQWIVIAGANGGTIGQNLGGAGGYLLAITNLSPGSLYTVVVGQSGVYSSTNPFPFGGACCGQSSSTAAGGGFSGIFQYNNISNSAIIAMVGGGGGASSCGNGGNGTIGNNGGDAFCNGAPLLESGSVYNPNFSIELFATTCDNIGNGGGAGSTGGGGGGGVGHFNSNIISSILDSDTLNLHTRCFNPNNLMGSDGAVLISCVASTPSTITLPQLDAIIYPVNPINQSALNYDNSSSCILHSMLAPPGEYLSPNAQCFQPSLSTRVDNLNYSCLSSTIYYVNLVSGSDSNPGTSMLIPFQTVQGMWNALKNGGFVPGIQVLFCNGDHHFNVGLDFRNGLIYNPYPSSWGDSGCAVKFSTYVCNETYANEMPLLSASSVLPQVTNSVGWRKESWTLLNGTVIEVMEYNLTLLNQIQGSKYLPIYYASSGVNNGIGSLFIQGVSYTLARHPNLPVIDGELTVESIYGPTFNQWMGADQCSEDISYRISPTGEQNTIFSAGTWCHHIWNDLFGQNSTLLNQFIDSIGFNDTLVIFPDVYTFSYVTINSQNPISAGTIDCNAWYNKYVLSVWPTFQEWNPPYGYVLDSLKLNLLDAQNNSNWKLWSINNTNDAMEFGCVGTGNGLPYGDMNGNPPGPPNSDAIQNQVIGDGTYGWGNPFYFSGPCYLMDMPGEYCYDEVNDILRVIPLNSDVEMDMLQTQFATPPFSSSLLGRNRHAATTYITGAQNSVYGTSIFSMYDPNCNIITPNLEFQGLHFGYGENIFSISIYNFTFHHCMVSYMGTFGNLYQPNLYNWQNDGNCPSGLLNPAFTNYTNYYVHNNIFSNVASPIFESTSVPGILGTVVILNNTIWNCGPGTAIQIHVSNIGYYRGNYIWNSAYGFYSNFQNQVGLPFDLYDGYLKTWTNIQIQYNYFNLTNNWGGDYSPYSVLTGLHTGNVLNNTMCAYYFVQAINLQSPGIDFTLEWANFSENILQVCACGCGSPGQDSQWFYDGIGPQYHVYPFLNYMNNILIDQYSQYFQGSPYVDGNPWNYGPYPMSYNVDGNTAIYLDMQIPYYPNAYGGNTVSPGTNWKLAIASLQLVPDLCYINQLDENAEYSFFRQSMVMGYQVPAVQLDPLFSPQALSPIVLLNPPNFIDAVQGQVEVLYLLTYEGGPYLAGSTPNPQILYGYENVQNYTANLLNEWKQTQCQKQQSNESFYTNMVTSLFPYYNPPSCWPPISPVIIF